MCRFTFESGRGSFIKPQITVTHSSPRARVDFVHWDGTDDEVRLNDATVYA